MRSPSVFERCDSGFLQMVFNFSVIRLNVHRVHCREEHGLSVFSVAFSSWDQSTLNNGVHLVGVPDVVDVLGEVIW